MPSKYVRTINFNNSESNRRGYFNNSGNNMNSVLSDNNIPAVFNNTVNNSTEENTEIEALNTILNTDDLLSTSMVLTNTNNSLINSGNSFRHQFYEKKSKISPNNRISPTKVSPNEEGGNAGEIKRNDYLSEILDVNQHYLNDIRFNHDIVIDESLFNDIVCRLESYRQCLLS